jgi:glycosyltransferase involved in cell wall biosynthesis
MSVLLVDWLGRGGIAQTTEAWALALGDIPVEVVTRPGRELGEGEIAVLEAPVARHRLAAHRAVATTAAQRIRDTRPDTVVVQNYVVPPLETPVFSAALAVGARIVQVVHDHRLHTVQAGLRLGLARRLRRADVVVTHSQFVADGVRRFATPLAPPVVIPLPVPVGMLHHPRSVGGPFAREASGAETLVCGQFGILSRSYKGADVMGALAASASSSWRFVAAGVGAPTSTPGVLGISEFLAPGALCELVAATDATIAPYRFATQSAVVVLAHVLGSVPVASAVGGIAEQIDDGVDGLLVSPGAPAVAWRDALAALGDDEYRKSLAVAGGARAWRDHDRFMEAVRELVR